MKKIIFLMIVLSLKISAYAESVYCEAICIEGYRYDQSFIVNRIRTVKGDSPQSLQDQCGKYSRQYRLVKNYETSYVRREHTTYLIGHMPATANNSCIDKGDAPL